MPHQDAYDARTNGQALKDIFADLLPEELANIKRHGNARVKPVALAAMAMICWGWSKRETLANRVADAADTVCRLFRAEVITTRQGLLKALAQCHNLLPLIVDHLARRVAKMPWRSVARHSPSMARSSPRHKRWPTKRGSPPMPREEIAASIANASLIKSPATPRKPRPCNC